jgi:hypothetical protein
MKHLFGDDARASSFRSLVRAVVVLATAFGLSLNADQVAAIQIAAEAVLQFGRTYTYKP